MNPIQFSCPHCEQPIECDPSYGGTEIQCPACTGAMQVPLAVDAITTGRVSPVLDIDHSRRELQGFEEYYLREIEPQMASRVEQQKIARRWCLLTLALGTPLSAGAIWWSLGKYGLESWVSATVIVVAALALCPALMRLQSVQKGVKNFLLPTVSRFFGLEYSKWVDVAFHEFDESGLLPKYDRRNLEDQFHGKPDGVECHMFECTLENKKTQQGENGEDLVTYKEIYHGVLFRFAFPTRFNGRTVVLKDGGLIGNFWKNFKQSGDKIKLADPRFEKLFEVWGSDEAEARRLLTPAFMQQMVELATAIDTKRVEFCFMNNVLLVSAHIKKDQFEGGGMFTSVTDKQRVERLVNEICRMFDIVHTLQLSMKTRI